MDLLKLTRPVKRTGLTLHVGFPDIGTGIPAPDDDIANALGQCLFFKHIPHNIHDAMADGGTLEDGFHITVLPATRTIMTRSMPREPPENLNW